MESLADKTKKGVQFAKKNIWMAKTKEQENVQWKVFIINIVRVR